MLLGYVNIPQLPLDKLVQIGEYQTGMAMVPGSILTTGYYLTEFIFDISNEIVVLGRNY